MTAPILDGVVLAAGLSTRAGGGKLTMELEGQAILARCLESMYDVCARIIVVTGHRRESLLPILRTHAKVEEVHNPDYAGGMFGSVLAGVRQVKAERFFLTPGDCPLIAKSTYTTLLGAGDDVAIPVFDGKRGHPLLMSSRLLAELLSYPVTATLEDFIRRQGAALVPVQDPGILMDVDTMEDFRRARGYLAQARPGAGRPIHLVTGGIGGGKSRRLREIFEQLGRGDGFVNRRVFSGGQTAGQDLVRLSSGESRPFSRQEGYIPDGWDERYHYDSYSFSGDGIRFAEDIVAEAMDGGRFPLFIDEIGPLELKGEGLAASFTRACRTGQELYVAVRATCLHEVMKAFNLVHCEIIRIDGVGRGNGKDES